MKRAHGSSQSEGPAAKKSRMVKSSKKSRKPTLGSTYRIPRTTLTRYRGPFPPEKKVKFTYRFFNTRAPAVTTQENLSFAVNDLFDPDPSVSGALGNKQPLYFDTLLTSTGPYKQYTVMKWEQEWTIVNLMSVPMIVFFTPTAPELTDIDTVTELLDYPGVVQVIIPPNGANSNITRRTNGALTDVAGGLVDPSSTLGSFSSSPTSRYYQGIVVSSADSVTNLQYAFSVTLTQHAQLKWSDATVS